MERAQVSIPTQPRSEAYAPAVTVMIWRPL